MKKNKIIKGLILSAITSTILLTTVYAGTAGSSDDPIVTKSYVDSQINTIMDIISNSNSGNTGSNTGSNSLSDADKKEIVEEVVAILNAQGGNTGTGSVTEEQSYVPVELQKGQIMLGGEGTEIIIRSGIAQAYVTTENGIVNATTGQDIANGQTVNKNNILIIPREDGRGIRAVSDSTWVLVKGSYTIQ